MDTTFKMTVPEDSDNFLVEIDPGSLGDLFFAVKAVRDSTDSPIIRADMAELYRRMDAERKG